MRKKALITGVGGQDGTYLVELLLHKNYEVHGLTRRSSMPGRVLPSEVIIHKGDMLDSGNIEMLVEELKPHEIYNLAAQSHVGYSFEIPEYTFNVNAVGAIRLLEAVRKHSPKSRVYQASTSEMFGNSQTNPPQNEETPFSPSSPYGVSKLAAHYACRNYRNAYNIYTACGILFNHESPRRGVEFLTRKVTLAIANIKAGLQKDLHLGNLSAQRDWGYAEEYVYAMWLMLQQDKPSDYVIATGETHSVKEFVEAAFSYAGLDFHKYVKHDEAFERPEDVNLLVGDASKAERELGWKPKVKFNELVKIMVDADENSIVRPERV